MKEKPIYKKTYRIGEQFIKKKKKDIYFLIKKNR